MPFNDLREFIDAARKLGQVKEIHGAHWELEIGGLTELFAFKDPSPLVIFDQVPGYAPNFRVASNLINTPSRSSLTVGMPADATPIELISRWKELLKGVTPVKPRFVTSGPILENVRSGDDVDMTIFPTPHWHELDGGRYIGTADCVITGEPQEGGWVNVGIYRVQIHDRNTLGLYVSPGHHARIMREKFWEQGKSCPVVVTFGQDPLLFLVAGQSMPYGMSEFDYYGGLRGAPIDVIRGELTGLPIPATAEIAIEGEVPPPQEQMQMEGPFGEWPGYYAHGAAKEPVIRVKRVYYRNDPILLGAPPLKPPASYLPMPLGAATLWEQLEKAGIPDVKGVWGFVYGGQPGPFTVVAIKQRYAGHAKQALLVAAGARAGAYGGKFVVVVDDDIDITNPGEVIWAIATRCYVRGGIDIIKDVWASVCEPAMPPEERSPRGYTSDRVLIDACRPYKWMDQFPAVNAFEKEFKDKIESKFNL
jgi:UbiD family decarboxylase